MFGLVTINVFGKHLNLWIFINSLGYILFAVYVFICLIRMQKKNFLCPYLNIAFDKHKKSIKAKRISVIVEAVIIALVSAAFEYLMNIFFGSCFGPVIHNYFGNVLFAPLIIIILCYFLGIEAMVLTDKIIPAFALQCCFSNIANYFAGCCAGKYWENGIYNLVYNEKQYPAPLYALAFSLIIYLIVVIVSKKSKKVGLCYPLFVILYSSTRLVTQFFRNDNSGTIFSLPFYTFQSIVCTIIGIILFILIFLYGTLINESLLKHNSNKYYPKNKKKAKK